MWMSLACGVASCAETPVERSTFPPIPNVSPAEAARVTKARRSLVFDAVIGLSPHPVDLFATDIRCLCTISPGVEVAFAEIR